MKNYKNYLIALLTGLLVLSLSTQQAQSAGTSAAAKAIQYDHCLADKELHNVSGYSFDQLIPMCAIYKP